ncbi:hypothetical protein EYF80_018959 [Liparis tanakae]|uniref:Uncharacterized protein n=1 Tax=Liparis tanakae TaxID=230148 RepID=A0A4Z2HZQ7_9TELE|nr:hypothetical protein EYF80_018959 [Liparis tanakae]
MPHARATGASSLLPWACPLQLGHEMLRRRPLPITVEITGGCREMNWFSPLPLVSAMPSYRDADTETLVAGVQ